MNITERLIMARNESGLTQQQAGLRCGISDSRISDFEKGQSEPRLGQLAKLAEVYHVALSYFFSEGVPPTQEVLWRNKPTDEKEICAEFLQLCRQYRQLEIWTRELQEKKLPFYENTQKSMGYPHVQELANDTRKILGLGDWPGESLHVVLEEEFGIKIFHLDMGVTGTAACAVSEEFGDAILLNKQCKSWRRNHDLAHELFHLLTWKYFRHNEGVLEPTEQEEKFATCFAGNLLLPTDIVKTAITKAAGMEGKIPFDQLDRIARKFCVSLESLLWRMHFLFNWKEEDTKCYIDKAASYVKTAPREDQDTPAKFPKRYRALAIKALQDGEISLGRFSKIMEISRTASESYLSKGELDYAEVPTTFA